MAIALNVFKTVTAQLTTDLTSIYTAPEGKTSIVLMASVANVTSTSATTTVSIKDTLDTTTELIKDFTIACNDAVSATTGKLVLETGYEFLVQASANDKLKITLSLLETVNG